MLHALLHQQLQMTKRSLFIESLDCPSNSPQRLPLSPTSPEAPPSVSLPLGRKVLDFLPSVAAAADGRVTTPTAAVVATFRNVCEEADSCGS